jgi:FSR family fosmidomycin resistance protein-like MFS transporter
VFHPEASKVAYMAAGNRRGLAQSIFQVGGNAGSSFGPLLAALIIAPYGQPNILWFSLLAFLAIIVLSRLGFWYKAHLISLKTKTRSKHFQPSQHLSKSTVTISIADLFKIFLSRFHDELLYILPHP